MVNHKVLPSFWRSGARLKEGALGFAETFHIITLEIALMLGIPKGLQTAIAIHT